MTVIGQYMFFEIIIDTSQEIDDDVISRFEMLLYSLDIIRTNTIVIVKPGSDDIWSGDNCTSGSKISQQCIKIFNWNDDKTHRIINSIFYFLEYDFRCVHICINKPGKIFIALSGQGGSTIMRKKRHSFFFPICAPGIGPDVLRTIALDPDIKARHQIMCKFHRSMVKGR